MPCASIALIYLQLRSWLYLSLDLDLSLGFTFDSPKSTYICAFLGVWTLAISSFWLSECSVILIRTPHPALLLVVETQLLPRMHWASSFSSELVFSCSKGARSLTVILMIPCHQTKVNYILDSLRRHYLLEKKNEFSMVESKPTFSNNLDE